MTNLKPIKALTNFLRENKKEGMTMAEIGVFDGSTTRDYIDLIRENNGKLYVVDWFKGNVGAGGVHEYNPDKKTEVLEIFKENLKGYLDLIEIYDGPSHEMIQNIPNNSLDFCFIDADHRYSFVFKDIELMIPKMKKGGIMMGHDYDDFDKNMISFIKDEYLEVDWVHVPECNKWAHCGVIKAVYDHFEYNIECRQDFDGQNQPIWIKRF